VHVAFAEALARSHGRGCALHVRRRGEVVVDLWGGMARGRSPWNDRTAAAVFSCTKGLVAILMGELVVEGRVMLDEPVASYWPEFAENGKTEITVRHVLAHRAGLPALRRDITSTEMLDWELMTTLLAAERPYFEPDSGHLYHAVTYGWLAGEIIRRVTGRSVGQFLQERISDPLGVDAWIGIPQSELHRVAEIYEEPWSGPPLPVEEFVGDRTEVDELGLRPITLGSTSPLGFRPGEGMNSDAFRQAELPGMGGIATARALATIWSAAVTEQEKVRLLSRGVIDEMTEPVSWGAPAGRSMPPFASWGSGFSLPSDAQRMLSPSSFGHDGVGGQVAFADMESGVGFAFVTNDVQPPGDRRASSIVEATRRALADM